MMHELTKNDGAKSATALHFFSAWLVGEFFYAVSAREVRADAGIVAFRRQIMGGVIISACVVGLAFLFGQAFRVRLLERWWHATPWPSIVLLLAALAVLLFGHRTPEPDDSYQALEPWAARGLMFAAIFAVLHFPFRTRLPADPETPVA